MTVFLYFSTESESIALQVTADAAADFCTRLCELTRLVLDVGGNAVPSQVSWKENVGQRISFLTFCLFLFRNWLLPERCAS